MRSILGFSACLKLSWLSKRKIRRLRSLRTLIRRVCAAHGITHGIRNKTDISDRPTFDNARFEILTERVIARGLLSPQKVSAREHLAKELSISTYLAIGRIGWVSLVVSGKSANTHSWTWATSSRMDLFGRSHLISLSLSVSIFPKMPIAAGWGDLGDWGPNWTSLNASKISPLKMPRVRSISEMLSCAFFISP